MFLILYILKYTYPVLATTLFFNIFGHPTGFPERHTFVINDNNMHKPNVFVCTHSAEDVGGH